MSPTCSAYPRDWDYKTFREIADSCGAILMCDMAHISGLVVTGEANSPFEYCDIVTTTTHKSLRGPRSGIIFFKKDERKFDDKINFAVFPMLQVREREAVTVAGKGRSLYIRATLNEPQPPPPS